MEQKEKLGTKVKNGLSNLKKHWKTPPDGYFVSYKEFVNYTLGVGSTSFLSVLIQWTSISMSIPLMLSYFKVSTGFIFISGIIGSLLGLLRAPILSMMIDNSNSKKGKFKRFLPVSSILTAISFILIPFIPEAWNSSMLFGFNIPSLPVFGVAASHVEISTGILVMFILVQIGTFFNTLLTQCLQGIEQTISSVAQERANIGAFKGLIGYIPSSIVNILLPVFAGLFFAKGDISGMNNIMLYRVAFPICAVGALLILPFTYFGTKERTVVEKEYVAKVKFWEGAKQLSCNKYFWILTIFSIAVGVRGNINMYLWICNYGIGGQKGDAALAVCNMLLNNALVPGMLVGPLLIKKMGKRNVMMMSVIGFTVMAFVQLFTIQSPYLMLIAVFFQNLFNGLSYISAIMAPDALDYQQWKTGKRLEGFWQNYNSFIATIIGFFTSALMPIFMSIGGVGFGDDIDSALRNEAIRLSTFKSVTWLGIIGAILCLIPMLFYDLTEKKHANYVRSLNIRAISGNFRNNELGEEDITKLKEIVDFANDNKDEFVLEELSKHDCIDTIYAMYKEPKEKTEEQIVNETAE